MRTDVNHGFNGEAHARLRSTHGLVLRVMGNIGCAVEQLVDAVATVALDHTAVPGLRVLLNDISGFSEQHAWLHQLNRLVQAFPRGLDDSHGIRICLGFVPDIVRLVDISVEPFMVQRNVDVNDIAILQWPLIGDTVADGFVDRGTDRLGEVHVIQRGRIRLRSSVSTGTFSASKGHVHCARHRPCERLHRCSLW